MGSVALYVPWRIVVTMVDYGEEAGAARGFITLPESG
jgi:hypothetical protein